MRNIFKILLGTTLLVGLFVTLGRRTAAPASSGSVYYGSQPDPWFRDDPWVDGHHWYGTVPATSAGIYIHPPRARR